MDERWLAGCEDSRMERVIHDVNGPLGAIVGFSQLILGREDIDPEVRHFADMILQESEKIHLLVLQLREVSPSGASS